MYDESDIDTLIQQRWLGPDGWAIRDRDHIHNNSTGKHKFPHDQRWDWSKQPSRQKEEEPDYLNFLLKNIRRLN